MSIALDKASMNSAFALALAVAQYLPKIVFAIAVTSKLVRPEAGSFRTVGERNLSCRVDYSRNDCARARVRPFETQHGGCLKNH